ncbi:MAG: adenylyl-sulfate kinase [Anaerolineae bacterium]|nr:adenylyl-sulfate kinase [Anaerolineae bacterium]
MNDDPHIVPYSHRVTREDRARIKGHQPAVLWFTGLSGSGKSTVADAVASALQGRGMHTYTLDGDNIRTGLNRDLGFSPEDRAENIRRIGEVAALFYDAGLIVLAAFISPYRADRDAVRALLPPGAFIEIHVDCPLEVCEQRDPKDLYQKARSNILKHFTGISAPYEPPLHAEITLNTAQQSIEASCATVLEYLVTHGIINQGEGG